MAAEHPTTNADVDAVVDRVITDAAAAESDDDLPMKHVFILELDTPVGKRVAEKFGKTGEYRVAGTLRADPVREGFTPEEAAEQAAKPLPPWVSEIVPAYLNDNVVFKQKLLEADVVICPMFDSAHEAAAAVRMLKNAQFDTEKTLVVISSVLTWADTLTAQKAEERAQREAERQAAIEAGEEVEDEDPAAAADGEAEEEEVPVFTEDLYQKRVPHPRYQALKEVEQAAKAANSETLHTYILFSGLPYGSGEDILEPFFKRAWHQQALPMHTDGSNTVPMIHIEDLANAAFKAGTYLDVLPTRYILAVDRGNHKWGQVVDALNKSMGCGESYMEPRVGSLASSAWITIDIRLEGATISDLIEESEWVAPEGFVAAIDKVCAEYRQARGLTPLRAAVVGPPLVGKSTVASRIADEYRVKRWTAGDVVESYSAYRTSLIANIASHRKARAAAKRKAAKDEKLKAEREALEEQRRAEQEAAEAAGEDGDEDGEAAGGAGGAGDDDHHSEGSNAAKEDVFEVSFEIDTPAGHGDDEDNKEGDGGDDAGEDGADGGDDDDGMAGGEGSGAFDPAADDDEDDEVLNKLKEELSYSEKVLSLKAADGRYVDESMAVMGRRAISSAASRNQGYVLDGFPRNVRQAASMFILGDVVLPEPDEDGAVPPPEEVDPAAYLAAVDGNLLLEHVVVCSATEDCLVARCSNDDKDNHRGRTAFFRRLAQYKRDNTAVTKPTHSLESWFGAILTNDEGVPRAASLLPVDLTTTGAPSGITARGADDDGAAAARVLDLRLNDIRHFLGEPRFVRPTPEMIVAERENAVMAAEEARLEALRQEEAAETAAAAAAAEHEKARANDDRRLRSVATERAEAAAVAAMPMNEYLMRYVAPAVADATAHVCELRPEDPLNTMADYLFTYEAHDTTESLRKRAALAGGGVASTKVAPL